MRILHGLTEVAGQGTYSVMGLNEIGLDSELVTWRRNPMLYGDSRSLGIGRSRWLYPWYAFKMGFFALSALLRFDVYHFHAYRSLLPLNLDLFLLKSFKKRVFMEFHGSELRVNGGADGSPTQNRRRVSRLKRVLRSVDAVILHDAELRPYLGECNVPVFYIPLRLNTERFRPHYPNPKNRKPIIVHAPSKPELKGTEDIIAAIERLTDKYEFEFRLVHGQTQEEAISTYQDADIIVDQILRGTYGVFTIEGMALGKPVICYLSDEMMDNFPNDLPVISANSETIEKAIESLILDGDYRRRVGELSRAYAENYHNYKIIALMLADIYYGNMAAVDQRDAFRLVKQLAQEHEV